MVCPDCGLHAAYVWLKQVKDGRMIRRCHLCAAALVRRGVAKYANHEDDDNARLPAWAKRREPGEGHL